MPKWTCSENESKNLFDELNRYMQEEVFDGKFQDTIPDGLKGVPDEVLDIQLPHVGINYAMKRNGNPFRVAIFGIEPGARGPGDSGNWDMKIKREVTEDFNEKPYTGFNPHMKGTLHTLQLLFGLPVDGDSREIEIDEGRKCKIFDAFCLSNARLYRETSESSDELKGPIADEIWKNCKRHFKKTIEIVQPQIIILQGDPTAASFNEAFCSDQEDKIQRDKVQIFKDIIDEPMLVLWLYHPHQRKGSRIYVSSPEKAKEYLSPKISELLQKYEEIWG